MSDFGTTAIQVGPVVPTEDEIMQVRNILQRAVDGLVGMSQLQNDVKTLQGTVELLQSDVETYRRTIANQDEAMSQLRNDREAARDDAITASRRAITAENRVNDFVDENVRLVTELSNAKHDRDTYGLQVMQLEDELKAAKAKLAAIQDGYKAIFGQVAPEAKPDAEEAWRQHDALPSPPNTTDEYINGERNPNYIPF